jgi:hypothetical protein
MAQLAYEGDHGPEIAYRIEHFGNRGANKKEVVVNNKKIWFITGATVAWAPTSPGPSSRPAARSFTGR